MNMAVITVYFNPAGHRMLKRNLLRFLRQMEAERVAFYVAELAYEDSPFLFPRQFPNVLQLRTERQHTMWHKENLVNLTERIVPAEFDALGWFDADVWFQRLDWYEATCEALSRHAVALRRARSEVGSQGYRGCTKEPLSALAQTGVSPRTIQRGPAWAVHFLFGGSLKDRPPVRCSDRRWPGTSRCRAGGGAVGKRRGLVVLSRLVEPVETAGVDQTHAFTGGTDPSQIISEERDAR
ncbi:MAG TPA: hypothetical protein VMN36_03495 [Verrucomicrobiales bacterium]|nr:hypothetical protein [Verrucomicrobiales bacterium]